MQQFLSDAQLAQRYDVSRSTIWRWSSTNQLPKPVKLSTGTTRWRKDQIEQHEQNKTAA